MYRRANGWPGPRAVLRDTRGFRYRLGRIDALVVIQWPIWKGHVKAALSGMPPLQTHLIMLVSVSTEACARLQIAWAGISKQLIVKLEKKMGTFFSGSYSNTVSFPTPTPTPKAPCVSLLFCSHRKCIRNTEPFPVAVPISLYSLGLFCLVKMCPVY